MEKVKIKKRRKTIDNISKIHSMKFIYDEIKIQIRVWQFYGIGKTQRDKHSLQAGNVVFQFSTVHCSGDIAKCEMI